MSHPTRRRVWLSEAAIVAALLLLPLLFWWRLWVPGPAARAVIPEGDFTSQYYPLQLFATRELDAGRLPAWNPYMNAGQPGLADIQTGAYYPPNLLLNLVLALVGRPLTVGLLTAQVVFHFALASLFTYLYVRHQALLAGARLPAARLAGAVAAVAFTYAGYLTSFPVQQVTILETAVWLPLILFFLDRAAQPGRALPHALLAGLAFGAALLAGHPQTAMYVAYATLAYGLFTAFLAGGARSTGRPPARWYASRAAWLVVVPLVTGAVVAAAQLVPTLVFIAESTRAGLGYEAVSWGFPLAEVTHLLYPGYFGGSPQYVGLVGPVLAAAACLVPRLRRYSVFWLVVGAGAFLLAFGRHTFVYNLAYLLLPGFRAVRNQERIIYLFSLAVAVLAGYGSLLLMQPMTRPVRKAFVRLARVVTWVWLGFVALTALWYAGWLQGQQQGVETNLFEGVLRHHALLVMVLGGSALLLCLRVRRPTWRGGLAALALGLIALNLYTVNWQYNLQAPPAGGAYPLTGTVQFLQGEARRGGTWRISSAGLLPGGSSAGTVYQLEDITGNTPLRWAQFARFEEQVGSWRRWQLLNVRYVLDTRNLDGPGLERVLEDGEVKVYRVGDPLPRAWVVHSLVAAAGDEALAVLDREDFNPKTEAVVAPGSGVAVAPAVAGVADSATVAANEPGRVALSVTAASDGLLVVSQPDYPGWQARVDGRAQPIYRVDGILQGIPIPAGSHQVELSYHLAWWPAAISLAVLLGSLALVVIGHRR